MRVNMLTEAVRRRLPWFLRRGDACHHVDQVRPVTPERERLRECLRLGDSWVHLRMCLTCGKVGCCDNSNNRHATAHFREVAHPIVQSHEPDEDWLWCYLDEQIMPAEAQPAR
jgi:uncharacterized UBP type Zn finger protein